MTTTIQDIIVFVQSRDSNNQTLSAVELAQFRADLNLRLGQLDMSVPGAKPGAQVLFYSGALWDGSAPA
jgi:hypothetical protein